MSVKAPAEKNFRRAKVKPVARSGAARGRLSVARALRDRACRRARRSMPATARSTWCCTRRRCRCGGSSCTATCGCRRGEVQALVDGLRGHEHPHRRPGGVPARGCWSRRGSPTSRCGACCRRPSKCSSRERRPIGLCRLGGSCTCVDRERHAHRRVRAAVRASSTCRSSTAWSRRAGRGEPAIDERARRAGRAGDRRAGAAQATCRSACRRSTSRDVARRGRAARRRPGAAAPRRGAVRSSGCSRTSSSRRRCASACRRSTTWTCGSTSGCTCGRRRRRPRLQRCQPADRRRTEGETLWHARNGTWSGSTSARRRSPPSSAR